MLSKKIILISTITLCFSIVGCKEEAKTTKWYRDHPDELKLAYEKCQIVVTLLIIARMQMKPTIKSSS